MRKMNNPKEKSCELCTVKFTALTNKQRFCTKKCGETKWNQTNVARKLTTVNAWKVKNPDKAKAIKLKRYYGLTLEQYRAMEIEQGHVCKICNNKCKTGRDLSVDHCHKTGKVRGLLCSTCNYMLGSAMDDTSILANGIVYLEKSKCE